MAAASRRPAPARAHSREAYLATLESLVDGIDLDIVAVDAAGKVLLMNRRMSRRICPGREPAGAPLVDLMPELAQERDGVLWTKVLSTHVLAEGRSIDARRQTLAGRVYDALAFPLRRGGAVLGAALVLRDVTERAQEERERVREARTASLANLSASVAHEIRNPLNSIALNIQLLREEIVAGAAPRAAEAVATVDTVLAEIRRLDRIVRDFLQFSKPPRPVFRMDDPNEAVLSAMRLLEGEVRAAGVQVTLDLEPLPACLIDRDRLSESIYNLALNAIQAMRDAASPRREIAVRTRREAGDVVVELADTGPGIPPEVRPRVFDLFFSTRSAGTGLGLPYANTMVAAHHGSLSLESPADGGTVATIRLPARIILPEEKPPRSPAGSS